MNDILDLSNYLQFIAALGVVILLITLVAAAGKRFLINQAGGVKRGKARRLSVIETLPLDARRRVLLVRRDDTEHLVLLGPDKDLVIEAGIAPVEESCAANTDHKHAEASPPVNLASIGKHVGKTSANWSSNLAQRLKGSRA